MSDYEKALSATLGRIAGELEQLGLPDELIEEIVQEVSNRIPLESEDQEDIADAERALAEPGPNISWEKIKKDLGL